MWTYKYRSCGLRRARVISSEPTTHEHVHHQYHRHGYGCPQPMLLSRSEQPPEFALGLLWGRPLTQLQSLTKTDSGITVTYSLVLLKTPWPLRVFSFPSELSQLFRCPGNFELSTILGPCKMVLPNP